MQQDQLRWTRWLVIVLASIGQCLSQALAANGTWITELGTNATTEVEASLGADSSGLLSRKKRFVVFPEGASFSVAVCMTVGVYGNPNYQMFSWALNWGIAYNLPNQTLTYQQDLMMPKPMAQRRNRRDLYHKLEVAMNSMGYDGRNCILRALCESSQYFGRKGTNMVAEMLRSLFSFPKSKVLSMEHEDTRIYDAAHRKGKNRVMCQSLYPECGFSLLELGLGKYASPYSFM
ncbi:uncharacterized protein LOC120425951 isoform X2 [Culex pipiens pallens]|uniref:uncharacterized protein LOC120425951 isoform X2 n=1 Tax=Culex pipiens pallens TaxID=42434 RepID=UPI00195433AA|nr:uncharacterized protein LOC120425951 isoform X2 [Culex pipiens pallens]